MSQTKQPKLTWGVGFANTISFGWGVDAATSWPNPRPGTEWAETQSGGAVDVWDTGVEDLLAFVVRWIPTTDLAAPLVTGWDGAAGWDAFLKWAWKGNAFRWYPDKDAGTFYTCVLVEPREMRKPGLDSGAYRSLDVTIRNTVAGQIAGY